MIPICLLGMGIDNDEGKRSMKMSTFRWIIIRHWFDSDFVRSLVLRRCSVSLKTRFAHKSPQAPLLSLLMATALARIFFFQVQLKLLTYAIFTFQVLLLLFYELNRFRFFRQKMKVIKLLNAQRKFNNYFGYQLSFYVFEYS